LLSCTVWLLHRVVCVCRPMQHATTSCAAVMRWRSCVHAFCEVSAWALTGLLSLCIGTHSVNSLSRMWRLSHFNWRAQCRQLGTAMLTVAAVVVLVDMFCFRKCCKLVVAPRKSWPGQHSWVKSKQCDSRRGRSPASVSSKVFVCRAGLGIALHRAIPNPAQTLPTQILPTRLRYCQGTSGVWLCLSCCPLLWH
jgi:hypothetical protein